MLNGKYITIDRVLDGFYRDYKGIFDNTDPIDAAEWAGEALELVGAPKILRDKVTNGDETKDYPCPISITNYRGKLPCDLYQVVQCRKWDTGEVMRRTTDKFHNSYTCTNSLSNEYQSSDITYKLNDNYIYTNFEEGDVEMAYRAIPIDDNGYPLIPDNVKFIKACKAYIAEKQAMKLWIQGKINNQQYNKFEQEVLWYINAADTSARTPTLDEATSWKNIMIRLIPNINEDKNSFRTLGTQEERYNGSFDR